VCLTPPSQRPRRPSQAEAHREPRVPEVRACVDPWEPRPGAPRRSEPLPPVSELAPRVGTLPGVRRWAHMHWVLQLAWPLTGDKVQDLSERSPRCSRFPRAASTAAVPFTTSLHHCIVSSAHFLPQAAKRSIGTYRSGPQAPTSHPQSPALARSPLTPAGWLG
jgi:hypothetical protein